MTFETFMKDPVNMVYAFTPEDLKKLKAQLSSEVRDKLVFYGEEAMAFPLQTVTKKEKLLLVTDNHDYESFSLYAWPDPTKEKGVPYLKRDGRPNPEHLKGDKLALRKMAYAVYLLGLLYYLTDEKKYYQRMKEHLQYFFLNPKTKMNPHLNHGQAMPGVNTGQRGGIIDFGVSFGYSLVILYALKQNNQLEESLYYNLCSWLAEFNLWLTESILGKEMNLETNNHAFVYDFTRVSISLFTGDEGCVQSIKKQFIERINTQITLEGKMPAELRRTISRNYTFMNMKLILEIGRLLDIDLKSEVKLKKMLDFYLQEKNNWSYQQIKPFPEVLDNYIYYIAKICFQRPIFSLIENDCFQYYIFKDLVR